MIFWHQHTLKWYSRISVLRILTALVCDFNSIIQGLYQNRATTYSWTHFFIPWEIKNPKIYSIPFLFCCFWIKKNTLSIWIGSFTWFIFNQTRPFTPLQSEKWMSSFETSLWMTTWLFLDQKSISQSTLVIFSHQIQFPTILTSSFWCLQSQRLQGYSKIPFWSLHLVSVLYF